MRSDARVSQLNTFNTLFRRDNIWVSIYSYTWLR